MHFIQALALCACATNFTSISIRRSNVFPCVCTCANACVCAHVCDVNMRMHRCGFPKLGIRIEHLLHHVPLRRRTHHGLCVHKCTRVHKCAWTYVYARGRMCIRAYVHARVSACKHMRVACSHTVRPAKMMEDTVAPFAAHSLAATAAYCWRASSRQ